MLTFLTLNSIASLCKRKVLPKP